jgi:hypothetical protein
VRVLDLPDRGGEHRHRNPAPAVTIEELSAQLDGVRGPVGDDEYACRPVRARGSCAAARSCAAVELRVGTLRAGLAGTPVCCAEQRDATGPHAGGPSTALPSEPVAPHLRSYPIGVDLPPVPRRGICSSDLDRAASAARRGLDLLGPELTEAVTQSLLPQRRERGRYALGVEEHASALAPGPAGGGCDLCEGDDLDRAAAVFADRRDALGTPFVFHDQPCLAGGEGVRSQHRRRSTWWHPLVGPTWGVPAAATGGRWRRTVEGQRDADPSGHTRGT